MEDQQLSSSRSVPTGVAESKSSPSERFCTRRPVQSRRSSTVRTLRQAWRSTRREVASGRIGDVTPIQGEVDPEVLSER
jgi:hypothetical protein